MTKRGCLFLCNENCMKMYFFCFLWNWKLVFLVCLAPFLLSRGPNLSVVNYQNPGKRQEKIKPSLCYGHYVTDITLWTSHYRKRQEKIKPSLCYGHYVTDITLWTSHYDCMTLIMVILLGEINATCIPILSKFITSKFSVLLTEH